MHQLWAKFVAVLLFGTMVSVAGFCPCRQAECSMAIKPSPVQATHSCCHKNREQSKQQPNHSQSNPSHKCANCRLAVTANVAPANAHRATLHAMPIAIAPPSMQSPIAVPMLAMLAAAEHVPGPPLLGDLFHNSCLLTI